MTTYTAPIGTRVLIPLDISGLIVYHSDPKLIDHSYCIATIVAKGYIGIRKGEKRPVQSPGVVHDDYLKVDPLIDWARAASGIRCYPALNRRYLLC